MTNAQTEARAIAWLIERLNGEADAFDRGSDETDPGTAALLREAATALAAKDAELAAMHQQFIDANEARVDTEARLAEANKALDALAAPPSPIQKLGAAISRRDWHEVEQAHASIRDVVDAARRLRLLRAGRQALATSKGGER